MPYVSHKNLETLEQVYNISFFLQIDLKKIALIQHINELSTYVFIALIGSLVRVCRTKYEGPKQALSVFIGGTSFGVLAAFVILIFFQSDKWASIAAAAFSLLCNELYDVLKIKIPEFVDRYITSKTKPK